jgi:predicted ferric reductase
MLARGAVWVAIYLAFILAPLFALMLGSLPPARAFWVEFSAALGYAGLAIMGLQFGLTARFRHVTAPWGEDVIYHFHRQLSIVAIALVVAHPLILFAVRPERMVMLNFIQASWRSRFAALSTYSLTKPLRVFSAPAGVRYGAQWPPPPRPVLFWA